MSLETTRKCDVCKLPMADGSRRFEFAAWVRGINGEEREAAVGEVGIPSDACSAKCVTDAVNELVRKVS